MGREGEDRDMESRVMCKGEEMKRHTKRGRQKQVTRSRVPQHAPRPHRDLPGGPVANPSSQCRGPGFTPWTGN